MSPWDPHQKVQVYLSYCFLACGILVARAKTRLSKGWILASANFRFRPTLRAVRMRKSSLYGNVCYASYLFPQAGKFKREMHLHIRFYIWYLFCDRAITSRSATSKKSLCVTSGFGRIKIVNPHPLCSVLEMRNLHTAFWHFASVRKEFAIWASIIPS